MSAKNCPMCGRVFEDMGMLEVCPRCREENEADFDKVRDYLYDFPNSNAIEVSEKTGVSVEKIKMYLRNERLIAVDNKSSSLLDCKKCGKPIPCGNYCTVCQREIEVADRKSKSYYKDHSTGKEKMYTHDSSRKK